MLRCAATRLAGDVASEDRVHRVEEARLARPDLTNQQDPRLGNF